MAYNIVSAYDSNDKRSGPQIEQSMNGFYDIISGRKGDFDEGQREILAERFNEYKIMMAATDVCLANGYYTSADGKKTISYLTPSGNDLTTYGRSIRNQIAERRLKQILGVDPNGTPADFDFNVMIDRGATLAGTLADEDALGDPQFIEKYSDEFEKLGVSANEIEKHSNVSMFDDVKTFYPPERLTDDDVTRLESEYDAIVSSMYHDYRIYGDTPVAPYDNVNFGFNLKPVPFTDTPSLANAPMYMRQDDGLFVASDVESDFASVSYFSPKGMSNDYRNLLSTRVTMLTNEYMKNFDVHMTITDAQEVREAIAKSQNPDFGVNNQDYYHDAVENAFAYISEKYGVTEPDEFRDYIANSVSSSYIRSDDDADDLTPADMLYNETDLIRRSGMHVVDVFGTKQVGPTTVHVSETDTVHAYLSGNKSEQLRVLDEINPGYEEAVNDTGNPTRHNNLSMGVNGCLVTNDNNQVYVINNGEFKSPVADRDIQSDHVFVSEVANGERNLTEDYIAGPAITSNDNFGISRLRKYMSAEDYNKLRVGVNTNVIPESQLQEYYETQHLAISNAEAILNDLQSKGLEYSIIGDQRPDQLRAKLEDRDLSIRLVDLQHPQYVGRVFGNSTSTYVSIPGVKDRIDETTKGRHPEQFWRVYKGTTGNSFGSIEYGPTPEDVTKLLDYRLGYEVESPVDIHGKTHVIGERGKSYVTQKTPSTPQSKKAVANIENTNSSTISTTNDIVSYKTVNITSYNNDIPVRVVFSSRKESNNEDTINDTNIENPEYGYTELTRYLTEARENFRHQIFDEIENEDSEVVNLSKDVNVQSFQSQYLNYIEHPDAIMQGINPETGEIVEETTQDYIRRKRGIEENGVDTESYDAVDEAEAAKVFTREEKLEQVHAHYDMESKKMFGYIDEENPTSIKLNVTNVLQYGGVDDKGLERMIQHAKENGYEISYVSEDGVENLNRLKERTVIFNGESATSIMNPDTLDAEGRPFLADMTRAMNETFKTSGCTVETLEIDNNGIVHYVVERDVNSNGDTKTMEGYIGQIFEPDENGVIVTKYDHENNKSLIPGYAAHIQSGDGSVESRTVLEGYHQMMEKTIRANIREQMLDGYAHGDTLNATALNSVYRHINAKSIPTTDYVAELRGRGWSDEYLHAYIDTFKGAVRYPSSLLEESTIRAEMAANKSDIIDNVNRDGYSVTGRNIAILEASEPGYFSPSATSGGTVQGLTRYLSSGATVDNNGRIIPTTDATKYNCPLEELDTFKYSKNNPFDREQMVFSNNTQALMMSKAKVAHMTLGGWNMDDANVISKEFAERNLVKVTYEDPTQMPPDIMTSLKLVEGVNYIKIEPETEDDSPQIAIAMHTPEGELTLDDCSERFDICDEPMKKIIITDGSEYDGLTVMVTKETYDEWYADGASMPFINEYGEEDDYRDYSYSEQVQMQLQNKGVVLRPLQVGDKICDMNGNKGVISLVVDRNMPDETAKALGIEKEVAIYKANPDLDVVSAPMTAPSRFNMGTVRGMREETEDLKMPDGSTIPGAIGNLDIIITDKTVSNKTHLYDTEEDILEGKGASASSQFVWQLEAAKADKLVQHLFKDNASNITDVREKLLVLGVDMAEDGTLSIGYNPHIVSGEGTDKAVFEDRPVMHLPEFDVVEAPSFNPENIKKNSYTETVKMSELRAMAHQSVSSSGGFMAIPFELELATGEKTAPELGDDGKPTGNYLLPLMPVHYRNEQTFDDGSLKIHNYTKQYNTIARQALSYSSAMKKNEAAGQTLYSSADLADYQKRAQDSYNAIANDLKQGFEGKYNVWKHKVMSHKMPKSATMVWSPDPRLSIDEIGMDRDTALRLNIKEGDTVMLSRNPLLRREGIAAVKVVYRDDRDTKLEGFTANPANDKRFDGDFDGDTLQPKSLFDDVTVAERNFLETYDSKKTEAQKKAYVNSIKAQIRTGVDRDGNPVEPIDPSVARLVSGRTKDPEDYKKIEAKIDNLREKVNYYTELMEYADQKFGVRHTLPDMCSTPEDFSKGSEVDVCLNLGLDVASATGKLRLDESRLAAAEGRELKPVMFKTTLTAEDCKAIGYEPTKSQFYKDETTGSQFVEIPMDDIYTKKNGGLLQDAIAVKQDDVALKLANAYVKGAFENAYASDYVSYSNWKDYFDSQNQIIVDHEAKGKIKAIENMAAYANVAQDIENYVVEHGPHKGERYLDAYPEAIHSNDALPHDRMAYNWKHSVTVDGVETSLTDMEYDKAILDGKTVELTGDAPKRYNVNTDVPFIDYKVPAVYNYGKQPYEIERHTPDGKMTIETVEPSKEYEELCEKMREDMQVRTMNVQKATSIKAIGTGNAGAYSQKGAKIMRNDDMLCMVELTSQVSQGMLQAKHNAAEAIEKYEIICDTLPALWKGQSIEKDDETGKWRASKDPDGKPIYNTPKEFIAQYKALCADDEHGLNVPIHESYIEKFATRMYGTLDDTEDNGKGKMVPTKVKVSAYKDSEYIAPLDRLAYGGKFEDVVALAKEEASIYDTGKGAKVNNSGLIRPEGKIAKDIRPKVVVNDSVMSYSEEASAERRAQKAEEKAERIAKTQAVLNAKSDSKEEVQTSGAEVIKPETLKDSGVTFTDPKITNLTSKGEEIKAKEDAAAKASENPNTNP